MEKSHYASIEIQDKLEQLKAQKTLLEGDWDLHWEELQLTLEVRQFARDAHLADEWIARINPTSTTGTWVVPSK
jgi:hypothetical protein